MTNPLQTRRLRRHPRGFTLVEMMTVVGIIGTLAAIAYPSYAEHVTRGYLIDGTNGLATMRLAMERHYQDNRTYMTSGTFTTPCALGTAASRTFGNFVITCQATPTDTAYTLLATGSGPVSAFSYTLNEQDVKATLSAKSGWTQTCATRWILKKGQACS